MQLGITLAHHDHAYVERRGGIELLTHLRAAGPRVEYRRQAIERAWSAFVAAEQEGRPDPEVGGLGLVVLQRSLLAAEDLGGLLYALPGPDHWHKLRTTNIPQLDEAYVRAATDTEATLSEAFRLVGDEDLREGGLSEQEIAAFRRLRVRVVARWRTMLVRATELWLAHRDVAKATMHGFPVVAREHVLGPPPAGTLAAGIKPPRGRWALAVTSTERDLHVQTVQTVIPLDRDAVARYRRDGRSVARLYLELSDLQAGSIMSGHKGAIPTGLVTAASDVDERLIEDAVKRQADE